MSINLENIKDFLQSEINLEILLSKFCKVTDYDDSPDLTDIHPKDRKDLNLYFCAIDSLLFPQSYKLINQNKKIQETMILGMAPWSQMYTHVDRMDLGPYAYVNWTSFIIPIIVPDSDVNNIGIKVEDKIFSIDKIIGFDAQIPHSAWNRTNQWWIFARLRVLKDQL